MNRLSVTAILLASLATAACSTAYEQEGSQIASAEIMNRAGANVGTARMFAMGDEVTVNVSLDGLPSGTHAVHLHTTGDCSAQDFKSAGGHLNPSDNEHGTLNPQGPHLGDMPNAMISDSGSGSVSTVLRGEQADIVDAVFDADGTAVVVHEGADDYHTNPAGAAGSRIACGVFSRS